MFREVRKRAQKAGQPPGAAVYTGRVKSEIPLITVITYSRDDCEEMKGVSLEECLPIKKVHGITWIHLQGLNNIELVNKLAERYHIHPLTVEDILTLEQRPKVEEFENYLYVTLKMLFWHEKKQTFSTDQLSLVCGKDFILSFQDHHTDTFKPIQERLQMGSNQRLRQHGSDYLAYRLIDTVIDQYFVVLEGIGDHIEAVEDLIISSPTPQNARTIYRLKRQLLMLRKSVWPTREALSRLLQANEMLITDFTRIYMRDVYDHTVQAIDTVETFRDMLAGMLDVYLSSLSTRMNEVMKVLTVIATIFIPITFIASFYGMNFPNMPEIHSRWGYPIVSTLMVAIVIGMIVYFRRKKWF